MTSSLPDLVGPRRDGSVSLADATIIAVLRAIQLGWRAVADAAERDAVVLSQELPMTHRLCAAMGRVVDSSQEQYPMRITPGTVVIPSEDAPRLVGLTDISIYLNGLPGHDPMRSLNASESTAETESCADCTWWKESPASNAASTVLITPRTSWSASASRAMSAERSPESTGTCMVANAMRTSWPNPTSWPNRGCGKAAIPAKA